MKIKIGVTSLVLVMFTHPIVGFAESSVIGKETVRFEAEYAQEVRDPENPDVKANPGVSPVTTGDLRIDFVPQFNFLAQKMSSKDEIYQGNAQLFFGDTGARGNFIQVSDYRGTGSGWKLQVRQETQFKNDQAENKELKGALISIDQSWVNSTRSENEAPVVSKDIIHMDNIGETYNLAEAKQGTGQGTWHIIFGSSSDNNKGRKQTLSPITDSRGKPILDGKFENKPMVKNSALTLSVPGATKKSQVPYETMITWILSELP
ncbi:hypothetical protein BCR26_06600 [Enterococcus rivorum]|uniref:WxL domain-containing protein n=1 Tax=Enterococcus rivorum TaxID=762845 RepID=A0A1E5KSR8_9ENTE|nr:hypothetical protein BCR26_06600 [Enterococcus rivorum]